MLWRSQQNIPQGLTQYLIVVLLDPAKWNIVGCLTASEETPVLFVLFVKSIIGKADSAIYHNLKYIFNNWQNCNPLVITSISRLPDLNTEERNPSAHAFGKSRNPII